ncbi:MAG: hypothetical protein K9K37_04075 [Desulfocapsa sp.]|nr:hypothetical protein [Desulfocapsa sp.]
MKRKTGGMTFIQQFRSCTSCGSVDGLEITLLQQQDDVILCQVCGAKYRLHCVEPLRLHFLSPDAEHAHRQTDFC